MVEWREGWREKAAQMEGLRKRKSGERMEGALDEGGRKTIDGWTEG